MNKIKVFLLLVVMITDGQYFNVFGQVPPTPTPFSCSELGQIILVGNGNSGKPGTTTGGPNTSSPHAVHSNYEGRTIFIRVNTDVSPATADTLFTIPYAVNGTGYNPGDGCLYSLPIADYTGTTAQGGIDGTTSLLRIDAKGVVTIYHLKAPSGTIGGGGYKGATVDAKGIMYINPAGGVGTTGGDSRLYAVDLNPLVSNPDPSLPSSTLPTMAITLNGTLPAINTADCVYDPLHQCLYGIESNNTTAYAAVQGKVIQISNITINEATLTGTATLNRWGDLNTADYSFGAMYVIYNAAGDSSSLVAWSNANGNFWKYPLSGTYSPRVLFSNGANSNIGTLLNIKPGYNANTWPAVTGNDGASCPGLNADIKVAKNDTLMGLAKGQSTTYTIVVSNEGPANSTTIYITDSVPKVNSVSTIMSFQIPKLYGNATSHLASRVSPTLTGMLTDTIMLHKGDSVVYTVTVAVPTGYPGDLLVNVANATPDNFTIDPDLTNNSDYDADSLNPPFLPVNPGVRITIHKR